MKRTKLKIGKNLALTRETLRQLTTVELGRAAGGDSDPTIDGPCTSMRTCKSFNWTACKKQTLPP